MGLRHVQNQLNCVFPDLNKQVSVQYTPWTDNRKWSADQIAQQHTMGARPDPGALAASPSFRSPSASWGPTQTRSECGRGRRVHMFTCAEHKPQLFVGQSMRHAGHSRASECSTCEVTARIAIRVLLPPCLQPSTVSGPSCASLPSPTSCRAASMLFFHAAACGRRQVTPQWEPSVQVHFPSHGTEGGSGGTGTASTRPLTVPRGRGNCDLHSQSGAARRPRGRDTERGGASAAPLTDILTLLDLDRALILHIVLRP